MDEKTKDKLTDVIGSIAAAPVLAGAKIVEAAHKIGEKAPALESMGEDIGSAAVKTKDAIVQTTKKISESDASKKVKDRFEQMSYTDPSATIKDALDKTQTAVRDFADKAKDSIVDNALKAKDGFADLKESVQEKRAADEKGEAVEDGFFEEIDAVEDGFFEEADGAEEELSKEADAVEEEFFEEGGPDEAAGAEQEEASGTPFEQKIEKLENSMNEFVEKAAHTIDVIARETKADEFVDKAAGKVEKIAAEINADELVNKTADKIESFAENVKLDEFVEKAAGKIEDVAMDVKDAVIKMEDSIHKEP